MCMISPAMEAFAESLSTLKFANRWVNGTARDAVDAYPLSQQRTCILARLLSWWCCGGGGALNQALSHAFQQTSCLDSVLHISMNNLYLALVCALQGQEHQEPGGGQ
jgi:hypothetical protein